MIYDIDISLEVAKGIDIGRMAIESLIEGILKEALPEAFLIRDVEAQCSD